MIFVLRDNQITGKHSRDKAGWVKGNTTAQQQVTWLTDSLPGTKELEGHQALESTQRRAGTQMVGLKGQLRLELFLFFFQQA